MKQKFRELRMTDARKDSLSKIDLILEKYKEYLPLSLRQVYYQMVAQEYIPNTMASYKSFGNIVNDLKYGGFIDWDHIEDRGRHPWRPADYYSLSQAVREACNSFRFDRWIGQAVRIEILAEKDAISNILYPLSERYHIYYTANRGYSSSTALYNLAQRIQNNADEYGVKTIILYLGDHDPSGLDMDRDVQERLDEFLRGENHYDFYRVALTRAQIQRYNPPPNPAKITDSRASGYIGLFGRNSWEVDALAPDVITDLVETMIWAYLDKDRMNRVMGEECIRRNAFKGPIKAMHEWEDKRDEEGS